MIAVVPIVTGASVVHTQPVSAFTEPPSTKTNAPGTSPLGEPLSKSVARVNTNADEMLPAFVTTYIPL